MHALPRDTYLQRLTSRLNHHRRLQQLSRWCRGTVLSLDSSAWPFELFLRLRWLLISPARAFMLPNHTHSVSLPPGSSSSTVAVYELLRLAPAIPGLGLAPCTVVRSAYVVVGSNLQVSGQLFPSHQHLHTRPYCSNSCPTQDA